MQAPDARRSTALQGRSPVGKKIMRVGYRPFFVLVTTLLANCGGTGGGQSTNLAGNPNDPSPPAPAAGGPFLDYDRPLVFTLGVPERMGPDDVSSNTTITISPALPAGLSLEAGTGAISGTPIALSAGQPYTLSAVNAQGTVTAKMNLEVNDGPLFLLKSCDSCRGNSDDSACSQRKDLPVRLFILFSRRYQSDCRSTKRQALFQVHRPGYRRLLTTRSPASTWVSSASTVSPWASPTRR